jgi:hypothetical protein
MGKKGSNPPPPQIPDGSAQDGASVNPTPPPTRPTPPPAPPRPPKRD